MSDKPFHEPDILGELRRHVLLGEGVDLSPNQVRELMRHIDVDLVEWIREASRADDEKLEAFEVVVTDAVGLQQKMTAAGTLCWNGLKVEVRRRRVELGDPPALVDDRVKLPPATTPLDERCTTCGRIYSHGIWRASGCQCLRVTTVVATVGNATKVDPADFRHPSAPHEKIDLLETAFKAADNNMPCKAIGDLVAYLHELRGGGRDRTGKLPSEAIGAHYVKWTKRRLPAEQRGRETAMNDDRYSALLDFLDERLGRAP